MTDVRAGCIATERPVFTRVLQQAYDLNYLFRKVKEEGYDRV